MSTTLLVDIEALLVAYLKAQSAITTLVSTRVSTELPPTAEFPALTLSRIGGIPDKPVFADHPQIQVEAWGRTKLEASNLARVAFRVLIEIPQVHSGGTVSDCSPSLGITWAPDDTFSPAKPRYIQGLIFHTHP